MGYKSGLRAGEPQKSFLHVWPYVRRFDEIRRNMGDPSELPISTKRSGRSSKASHPIFRLSILEEFDLKTHEEHTRSAEAVQDRARNSS